MTKENLEQIIKFEIDSTNFENWHGITRENINKYLIEPTLVDFIDAYSHIKKYWVVLDEDPKNMVDGYQIIYDQEDNMFGLATKITKEPA